MPLAPDLPPSLLDRTPQPGWSLPGTKSYTLTTKLQPQSRSPNNTRPAPFLCHCHCSKMTNSQTPAVEVTARGALRASCCWHNALCHMSQQPEEGSGPLGTSQEMNPSPAACYHPIDFYALIIAVVSGLWIVIESDSAETSAKVGSRMRESAAQVMLRASFQKGTAAGVLWGRKSARE